LERTRETIVQPPDLSHDLLVAQVHSVPHLLATSAVRTGRVVAGTTETVSESTLERRRNVCRGGGCRWRRELVIVIANGDSSLERRDRIGVRMYRVELANDRLPARIFLREVLEHPVCHLRVGKRLPDASELLVRDGKVLEIFLNRATNVRMVVYKLLGIVRSQPKVLRPEFASDGVPNVFGRRASEDIRQILATECTLDDTHSHTILDPPIVIFDLPLGNGSVVSCDRSRDEGIGSGESGRGVWRKITRPSLDVLGDLFTLQVRHDLLLPFDHVVLRKPRKAIRGVR